MCVRERERKRKREGAEEERIKIKLTEDSQQKGKKMFDTPKMSHVHDKSRCYSQFNLNSCQLNGIGK